MKQYIVLGVGNYTSDIFDIIHANQGVVYKIYKNLGEIRKPRSLSLNERVGLLGYPVSIYDSLDAFVPEEGCSYVIGILTVHKYSLIEEMKAKYALTLSQLVHPRTHIGSNVHIGEGVIVNAGVVIGPNVRLDDFCSVNRLAAIGHDIRIGKYTSIGPAVALGGGGRIGDKCVVGMGANVLEQLEIGDWAVIGAGAVVTRDIPEKVIAYGVPAKVIRPNEQTDFESYVKKGGFLSPSSRSD